MKLKITTENIICKGISVWDSNLIISSQLYIEQFDRDPFIQLRAFAINTGVGGVVNHTFILFS